MIPNFTMQTIVEPNIGKHTHSSDSNIFLDDMSSSVLAKSTIQTKGPTQSLFKDRKKKSFKSQQLNITD